MTFEVDGQHKLLSGRRVEGMRFRFSSVALALATLLTVLVIHSPSDSRAMSCEEALLGHAANLRPRDLKRNYEASETLSQKSRDNAPYYWAEMRTRKPLKWSELPPVLRSQVIAIGDLHSGNFSPIFVPGKGVLYTLFDVKDLGYAPALFDINRLILNAVAIASRRHKLSDRERQFIADEILVAYRQGLMREDFNLTTQYALELPTPDKFQRKLDKKQLRRIESDGLFGVDGESTRPISFAAQQLGIPEGEIRPMLEKELRTHLGWGHLRDAIVNLKDRGGSKDQMRIMVLFETQDGRLVMKELKRVGESAVSAFQDQPSLNEVQTAASRFLDYDIGRLFPQINIGGNAFVMRDKKVESISVPYKQKQDQDFARLMDLSRHHAQWVGTFHGRQLFAQSLNLNLRFAEAVRDHHVKLVEEFDAFNRGHIGRLNGDKP